MSKVLLTFDIDGTLMNCIGGRLIQRKSFMYAFNKYFNKEIEEKNLWGKMWIGITDSAVAHGILEKHKGNVTHYDVERFLKFYDEKFISLCEDLKPKLTPGIREAIEEVKKMNDVVVTVATGNTEKTAKLKIDKAGLSDLFTPFIGGFGTNMYRYQCIMEAKKHASEIFGNNIKGSIHIGDTNNDIEEALRAGSFPVGVMTGIGMQKYVPGKEHFISNLKDQKNYLLDQIERIRNM